MQKGIIYFVIILLLFPNSKSVSQNLITNGSFENYIAPCPTTSPNGALHGKVYNWYAGGPYPGIGFPSVDLYCGQPNYSLCEPGPPLLMGSDGAAYAGFHTRIYNPPYNEAIYQILGAPLITGQTYFLSIDLMTCQGDQWVGSDDFHVYSNIDSIFPICPMDSPSVQLLGTIPIDSINNVQWKTHVFSFLAPSNSNVIIFSGTCDGTQTENYYYVDNIILTACNTTYEFLGNDTSLCQGETLTLNATTASNTSYLWQDSSVNPTYTVAQAGTFWVQVNVNNCSRIDTVNISFTQPGISQNISICDGDSAFFSGNWQKFSGAYFDTLTAANGCDSIITSNLTVLSASATTQNISICTGDSIFLFGAWQPLAGTYYDTLNAANGCDSIVASVLSILPGSGSNQNISICSGDSIFTGGNWQNGSGTYYDTITASNGCDSVIVTTLNVNPVYSPVEYITLCNGDSIFIGGNYQTTAGTYYDTLSSLNGCDSILATNLIVLQAMTGIQNISICSGDSIFLSGNWQTTGGAYYDTVTAINGCDSIIETNLAVLSTSASVQSISICMGDSAFLAGSWQTTAATYYDTLLAGNGCDSVISSTLNILPDTFSGQNFSICTGDSIFTGGSWQNTDGTYYDTLIASNGCDSVVTSILNILPNVSTSQNLFICNGDSVFLSNVWQTANGTYYDTLVAINGCDSVVVSNLVILPDYSSIQNISICYGDSIFIGGEWQSVNGTYYDTLTALNGCDSIIESTLTTVLPPIANITADTTTICSGESTELTATGGTNYLWSSGETTSSIMINPNTSLIFIVTVSDSCGSDNDSIQVIVLPSPLINAGDDITISQGTSVQLTASGGNNYLWSTGEITSAISVSPVNTTEYSVTGTDNSNCSDIDTVIVYIDGIENNLYLPTIFSPNGDGNNDVFRVRGNNVSEGYIAIYDRWGEKIYELQFTGNDLNDIGKWWDGSYRGKPMNTGVFVYFAKVTCTDGKVEEKKGNVTLVR